ncbi:polysaccharide pyruvyl transferase family protein [Lachnospiraceae bacterium 54-53]
MKVAVITRHSIFNYGSLLQTIATQTSIENLGYDCEIIDYQRDDENYRKIADVLVKRTVWNKNFVSRMVYRGIQSPKFWIMGRHFEKLRNGAIKTTRTYRSFYELKRDKPNADIFMTGSDQVWGPIGDDVYDPVYFLDFAEKEDICVSYATSFGKTEFTDEVLCQVKKLLWKYNIITVREKSAVDIIDKMNVGPVTQVLDPTLLHDSVYWSKMVYDDMPKDYILIYQLHSNPRMLEYAYELAARTGLKLVSMSSTAQHLAHSGSKHIFLPSLSEWLGYIKNARFVITDSFHGTAFAINFNTQFANILPEGTSTRNQSILELTGLTNRIVTDYHDFSVYDSQIDYYRVNKLIQEKREASIKVLEKMLAIRK